MIQLPSALDICMISLAEFRENQRRVGASKAETVRQSNVDFFFLGLKGNKIEFGLNIRFGEIESRGERILSNS